MPRLRLLMLMPPVSKLVFIPELVPIPKLVPKLVPLGMRLVLNVWPEMSCVLMFWVWTTLFGVACTAVGGMALAGGGPGGIDPGAVGVGGLPPGAGVAGWV